jgi:hypothetical protein
METIGDAARRLLARLDRAAKAGRNERGAVSGCCPAPTAPLHTGESTGPNIAPDEPMPRGLVSANDNRRHAAPRCARS